MARKNWIQGAISKEGSQRLAQGAKEGEPIPRAKLEAAARKPGKTGQRARLAMTLRRLNKG